MTQGESQSSCNEMAITFTMTTIMITITLALFWALLSSSSMRWAFSSSPLSTLLDIAVLFLGCSGTMKGDDVIPDEKKGLVAEAAEREVVEAEEEAEEETSQVNG